jgi:UDP-glucose 4-epimerase
MTISTGFPRLAQGFELVEGDIADESRLRPVLARVDAVMHFASHASVREPVEKRGYGCRKQRNARRHKTNAR